MKALRVARAVGLVLTLSAFAVGSGRGVDLIEVLGQVTYANGRPARGEFVRVVDAEATTIALAVTDARGLWMAHVNGGELIDVTLSL